MTNEDLIDEARSGKFLTPGERYELIDRLADALAAVPDSATEPGYYQEGIEEGIKIGLTERDAAIDAVERLHAQCDCVPDLGPAHCHLCGNEKGSPVPWPECAAVLAAAPAETEYEYKYAEKLGDTEYTYVDENDKPFRTWAEANSARVEDTDYVVRRRKAGPWLPVPGGEGGE